MVFVMEEKNNSVCFTGHRKIRKKDTLLEDNLYKNIEDLITKGFIYFYAGGAKGFDALASKTVIKLKEKYSYIQLILVLPFHNQFKKENDWSFDEIKEYEDLKKQALKVIHIQEEYSIGCYYRRNMRLVDLSSVCVCYEYKNHGGTAYTVEYAGRQGLKIVRIEGRVFVAED